MARRIIYRVQGLNHGELLREVSLEFFEGAKVRVEGGDPQAKRALLEIIAGERADFTGLARATEDGVSLGYLGRVSPSTAACSVWEHLKQSVYRRHDVEEQGDQAASSPRETPQQPEPLHDIMARHEVVSLESRIGVIAAALGLPLPDEQLSNLSNEDRRRVALCRLLLEQPGMLLIDDPTAWLDSAALRWLDGQLLEYPGLVLLDPGEDQQLGAVFPWSLEVDGRVTLRELPVLAGVVRGQDGEPLEACTLVATSRAQGGPAPRVVSADHTGQFELPVPVAGEYRLEVFERGQASSGHPNWWLRVQPIAGLPSVMSDTRDLILLVTSNS